MAEGGARSRGLGAQSRIVMLWKALEYAGLAAFVVLMPRLMEPELYGRFAALVSFISFMTMAVALGAQATFGRYVPEFEARGERLKTRVLFTQVFAIRILVASGLALALLRVLPGLLPGASPATVAAAAAAFFCVAVGMVCSQLFYGLNDLGRSLAHDGVIRAATCGLVLLLGGVRDLERASLAILLAELLFLALGLAWARSYFTADPAVRDWSELPAQLRLGLTFFGANLLVMAVWRGGELAVLMFSGGRGSEVAFYSVANAVVGAVGSLLGQFGALLLPSLTALHVSGRAESVDAWLGYALKYMTIAAVVFYVAAFSLGEWLVRRAISEQYLPVIVNLKTLALSLLPLALVRTGMSVALVRMQNRRALVMAGGGSLAFLALAAALVPPRGSHGASLAATLAFVVTGTLACALFELRGALAAARFGRLVACALPALAALLIPVGPGPVVGTLSLALFAGALFATRVLSVAEVKRVAAVLGVSGARGRAGAPTAPPATGIG